MLTARRGPIRDEQGGYLGWAVNMTGKIGPALKRRFHPRAGKTRVWSLRCRGCDVVCVPAVFKPFLVNVVRGLVSDSEGKSTLNSEFEGWWICFLQWMTVFIYVRLLPCSLDSLSLRVAKNVPLSFLVSLQACFIWFLWSWFCSVLRVRSVLLLFSFLLSLSVLSIIYKYKYKDKRTSLSILR